MSREVLRGFRADDAYAISLLRDRVDPRSTVDLPWDVEAVGERMADADWAVVAGDGNGPPIGWASLHSWDEDDGTTVYLTGGFVAPAARGRGLGGRLLRASEAAAAGLAGDRRARGPIVLGGNASTLQPDRAALLERHGYRPVFALVEMEYDRPAGPPRPLPGGVTVRTAEVDDAPALRSLSAAAWAGRPYFTLPSEDRFRDWLRRSDRSRFHVGEVGGRPVGFVAATVTAVRTEIEDVTVHPDFQRRGLATALLTRALITLPRPVRLHTEAHDPAGARSLYERLGFRVVSEHGRYRKALGGRARR